MRFASTTKSVKLSPIKKKRESFGLISIASKSEKSEGREETIEGVLKNIQDLSKECNIFDLVFISSKMRGDNYLENKEFSKALAVYKFLRVYCRIAQRIEEEMNVAHQLGHLFRFTKNHPKAADMFRLVLKYAWICKDNYMELKSYDNLSYEHFQMGNLGKSKYYSERFSRGLIESNLSKLKSSCVQPYKDWKKVKKGTVKKLNISNINKATDAEILPSPSNENNKAEKFKTMFDIIDENEKHREIMKKKKLQNESNKENPNNEEENDEISTKSKYKYLFDPDIYTYSIGSHPREKVKKKFMATKQKVVIESIDSIKFKANQCISTKRKTPHICLTFEDMVKNAGSASLKKEHTQVFKLNFKYYFDIFNITLIIKFQSY